MKTEALEVSNSWGELLSHEYINALRTILQLPPMTDEQYERAVQTCERLGRDAVVTAHRNASDSIWVAPQNTPSLRLE